MKFSDYLNAANYYLGDPEVKKSKNELFERTNIIHNDVEIPDCNTKEIASTKVEDEVQKKSEPIITIEPKVIPHKEEECLCDEFNRTFETVEAWEVL